MVRPGREKTNPSPFVNVPKTVTGRQPESRAASRRRNLISRSFCLPFGGGLERGTASRIHVRANGSCRQESGRRRQNDIIQEGGIRNPEHQPRYDDPVDKSLLRARSVGVEIVGCKYRLQQGGSIIWSGDRNVGCQCGSGDAEHVAGDQHGVNESGACIAAIDIQVARWRHRAVDGEGRICK